MLTSPAPRRGLPGYLAAFVCLLAGPVLAAGGPVTVTVDPGADRHPVSPLLYGVNFGSTAQTNRLHWPVRRWGGNATTRYSWQDDTSNRASDYLFYNIPETNAHPENLPNGSAVDVFVDQTRAAGGEALITVPLIGWTPVDRSYRWGFSIAKYGAQQQNECTINPFQGCNADAGNGVRPDGTTFVTGNDPHDTSKAIDPTFVTGWMAHLAARTGTAAQGGVRLFDLDNEPALWNSSHRDVHPVPTTYDELWQQTQSYTAAIKAQDPGALTLGPVSWGWCEYFYSALDGCSPGGPDMTSHGNLVWIDWYLKQAAAYQAAHGVRLLDYLDVHYYPQAGNVTLSNDESTATSALRLRTLKSLYDPNYIDESWISDSSPNGVAVMLIPRLKAWIANRFPGTKIALTEYNWGDGGTSSALAQAEVLGILGREGVDLAARWVAPTDNSVIEDAFLLYLNYDGAGAKVAGDSVRAVSSDVDGVGSYAIRGAGTRLWVLLFNKDTVARSTTVQVTGGLTQPATLYRFDGTHRLGAAGTASPTGGALTLSLPARSATLAVLDLEAPPPAASYYTLTPCRLIDTRNAAGPYGGPALSAGERTFNLAGTCGIPTTAQALAVNLTVVAPAQGGDLRAFAAGSAAPLASALNFGAGQTRTNNAILPVTTDGNGGLTVHLDMGPGTAQVIADVFGYFQ
jgi:hypothetical protein